MTQAEWLDASRSMQEPLVQLMDIAHGMNISGPVTIAVNRDGMSWAEYDEAGHLYEIDIKPDGSYYVRRDREMYFSGKGLTATSGATNVTAIR